MQLSILIVDDEKAILCAMAEYFVAFGYRVDCARDTGEAQALLVARPYSVLITDLRLHGCQDTSGLDIAHHARALHPSLRTILLTAHATPEIERLAQQGGIDVCVSKPRPLDEIAEIVSRLTAAAA